MWPQDRIRSGSSVMDLERGVPIDIFETNIFTELYAQAIDDGYTGFLISAKNIDGGDYRVHYLPKQHKPLVRAVNRRRVIHYFYSTCIHFDRQSGIWGEELTEKKETIPQSGTRQKNASTHIPKAFGIRLAPDASGLPTPRASLME